MSDLTVAELETKLRHQAIHHDAAMRSLQSRHNVLLRQLLKAVELAQHGSMVQKQYLVDYQLEVMHDDLTKATKAIEAKL
jgi:ribosome-associated protein YbcJ (S4-like RNA binding protein)